MQLPHSHGQSPAFQHHPPRGRLLGALAVTSAIMVAEGLGGLWSHSLALFADAGHMLTDVLALGVAYAALALGGRPADMRRTYGYRRLEVLAALLNSIALVAVSGWILYAAVGRWLTPPDVDAPMMMTVATAGLVANLASLWLLGGHHGDLNMRGAFLHILGDTLSSVAVVAGGGMMLATGWTRLDPLLSVGISAVIMVTSYKLLREVVDVLLEAVPRGIDADEVKQAIGAVSGVSQVHDLHIWSITAGMPALSAHVVVQEHGERQSHQVLTAIQSTLRERYAITHATLQLEHPAYGDCGCAHQR